MRQLSSPWVMIRMCAVGGRCVLADVCPVGIHDSESFWPDAVAHGSRSARSRHQRWPRGAQTAFQLLHDCSPLSRRLLFSFSVCVVCPAPCGGLSLCLVRSARSSVPFRSARSSVPFRSARPCVIGCRLVPSTRTRCQECVRLLVDAFAADVNAKDNAGRTPMATLIARHRSQRPGIGPHAAMKLQIIDGLIAQREVEEEGSMYSLEDDDEYGRPDSASVPGGMASPTSTSSSAMLMVGARPVTVAHCCIMLLLLLALLLLVPLFSSSRGFCCDLCVCGIRSGRASHPCSARAGRRSPSRETWPRRCACCEWPRPGSWRACERASGVADSGSSGGCRINT